MYVVSYGNMRTGEIYGTLNVDACAVTDELRRANTFRAHIPTASSPAAWSKLTNGPGDMWFLEWDQEYERFPLAGGPLLTQEFDANGIDLVGAGIWWIFGQRIMLNRSWTPTESTAAAAPPWQIENQDLGTIMQMLCLEVSKYVADTALYAYLPISGDEGRTGTHTRTYQPYDLVTVMQRVEELGDVEVGTNGLGGPDWILIPRFIHTGSSSVTWRFRTGTQAQPMIFGDKPPLMLDASAPGQKLLRNLTGTRNGASKVTRAFSSGAGSEGSKIIKVAEQADKSPAIGIRIDSVYSNDSTDQTTVKAYADSELTRHNKTPSELSIEVDASWFWTNGGSVGIPVRLLWANHPVVGDIDVTTRVLAWSLDVSSPWVKLTLADTTVEI